VNDIKPKTKHGYVVSDLHMFARWSSVSKYLNNIREAASNAGFFVFNGDIFDFKWSVLQTVEETSKAAIEWFTLLCRDFPDCQFYYVLGNHDCHESFLEHLNILSKQQDNFHWHNSHITIGKRLFIHGDLVFSKNNDTLFERKSFMQTHPKASRSGKIYHFLIKMGAHAVLKHLYTKEKYAHLVSKALNIESTVNRDNIKDIYLGHTHVSFSDYEYNGITYHNTGSAVHDLHCNMLKFKHLSDNK